jgi:type III secretory pathway component EscR
MVVHVVSIVALVVLMATSHLDTTIGLPLLTGLLGLGTGVGLNVAPTTTPVVVAPTNPVV